MVKLTGPRTTTNARELTAEELGRLSSKARVFGDSYRVKIEHSESVRIGPQETAEVKYTVQYRGDETGWSRGVVGARGVNQAMTPAACCSWCLRRYSSRSCSASAASATTFRSMPDHTMLTPVPLPTPMRSMRA